MIASLKERLDDATAGGDLTDRLMWLFAHLDEYLERWLGFSDIDTVSMRAIVQSDLHVVLLLGITVTDEEMRQIGAESRLCQEWERFARLARSITPESSKGIGRELSEKLARCQMELEQEKNRRLGPDNP